MKKPLILFSLLVGGVVFFEIHDKAKVKAAADAAKAKAIKDQADANDKWKTNTLWDIKQLSLIHI